MVKQPVVRYFAALLLIAAVILAGAGARAEKVEVDAKIKSYKKVSGVSGNLGSIGSDTMVNLVTLWREAFVKLYPGANITVEGKGSATAPPALVAGTAQIGPMSRTMKDEESAPFEAKYGFKPTAIGVALDALSVFVSKDNPLDTITLAQLDGVFSKTRKSGYATDVTTWGQLGLTGDWANKPISLYGRNSASGTYGFFKEHVLAKGDYKDTVKEQPGSAAVVQGVTEDKAGIGYSGLGYVTSGVKALTLTAKEGEKAYAGTYANVLSKKYPLSRLLYVYVVKAPGKPLDPVVLEFLKFALSKEGQEIAIKDGYLPLTPAMTAAELKKLNQ